MTLTVYYFAAVRDLVGKEEEHLEVPASVQTVASLLLHLRALYPALVLEGVRTAKNEEFCAEDETLAEGDVIALIPPVSGG